MPAPRTERRFEPASATPPGLLLFVLNAGALAAGAGAVGFYLQTKSPEAAPYTTEALAAGALLLGVATALSANRGVRVRVGAAGVAFEKADLVRVPWHGLARLDLEGGALRIEGRSEFGAPVSERCSLQTHRAALAALVAEAKARVPAVVTPEVEAIVGAPTEGAGEALPLEPVQVAGRRCAATEKPIAFEGDGLVCARCERVYLRAAAPASCACGAALEK
jgi:hypothetical protein